MERFRKLPLLPFSYYCYYCWPYLNWAIAILALIIVVAAYLVNYNTLHNRRRLAREQFSAMMKNVTQASNFAFTKFANGGLFLLISKAPGVE